MSIGEAAQTLANYQGLGYRERTVLAMLYGLNGPSRALAEIAAHLGISETRVLLVARQALRCLAERPVEFVAAVDDVPLLHDPEPRPDTNTGSGT